MFQSLSSNSPFQVDSKIVPTFSGKKKPNGISGDDDGFSLSLGEIDALLNGKGDVFDINHMTLSQGIGGISSIRGRAKQRDLDLKTLQPTLEKMVSKFCLSEAEGKRFQELVKASLLIDSFEDVEARLNLIATGEQFNLSAFEESFLKQFFNHKGVNVDEIAPSQIGKWNLKYFAELSEELTIDSPYQGALKDLCQATLQGSYPAYLHDPNRAIGCNNLKTKSDFRAMGLDYDQWLKYSGSVQLKKPGVKSVQNRVERILQEMESRNPESIEMFRTVFNESGLNYVDGQLVDKKTQEQLIPRLQKLVKALPSYVMPKSSQFELGARNVSTFETDPLLSFTRERSEVDSGSTELLYLGEVKTRLLSTLFNLMKNPAEETLTIRQWQREPGKDLFQANDTGSCIALGFGRGEGSLDVMENTFVQLAEFYNHAEEKVTGKALFFWCRDMDRNGEPILVINTFEGRDSCCEEDPAARDALLDYARGLSKAVSGRDNIRIFTAHHQWNPLYKGQGQAVRANLHPIGDSVTGQYYFDTFGSSWVTVNQIHKNVPIVQIYPA